MPPLVGTFLFEPEPTRECWHEAGHAVTGYHLGIPVGAIGFTWSKGRVARPFALCAKAGDRCSAITIDIARLAIAFLHAIGLEALSTGASTPLHNLYLLSSRSLCGASASGWRSGGVVFGTMRLGKKVWWRSNRNGQRESGNAWGSIRRYGGGANQHEFPGPRRERERPGHPSITYHQVIMRHGGEAAKVRENYENLPPIQKQQLRAFLNSL